MKAEYTSGKKCSVCVCVCVCKISPFTMYTAREDGSPRKLHHF